MAHSDDMESGAKWLNEEAHAEWCKRNKYMLSALHKLQDEIESYLPQEI